MGGRDSPDKVGVSPPLVILGCYHRIESAEEIGKVGGCVNLPAPLGLIPCL